MHVPVYYVDAFTDQPFTGNPAAVCVLNSWLDDESLRKVAAENNLSATAFLVHGEEGYEVRWFTSRCEIKLCGHATLAAAHVMLAIVGSARDSVRFHTRHHGILTIQKDGDLLAMNFPAFFPHVLHTLPDRLIEALGNPSGLSELLEVNDTYIVVFNHPGVVRNLRPNFALLESLHPHVVSVTAKGDDEDFVSRYFAPTYGTPEDPVTGSAHCVLAPYWAKRLGKSHLHARQLSERGGELWCDLEGDRVIVKGKAVLTMQGSLSI
ncbi:MAG TPA: PhzF family phenazine biosynthesis protein [Candidatus Dormibacteraeota bacterium]|nr:PhzF family phenazine biosynthesis protein [Candidatus Dormibacteraeota bacterium]